MLKISSREVGDVLVVDLRGQIDGGPESAAIHDLVKEEAERGKTKFLLNMGEVPWLNSLGLGVLISAYVSAKRQNAALRLCNLSDRSLTLFRNSGVVPEVFETFASEEEGLKSFA